MIVYDGDDPMTEFYTNQKTDVEKYYRENKLYRLKARLAQLKNKKNTRCSCHLLITIPESQINVCYSIADHH